MFSVWESMNTNNGNLNISNFLSEVCLMVIWYPCLFSRALFLRHMAEGRFKWHLTLSRIVGIDPFPWLLWFSQWRNWRLIELKERFLDWKKNWHGLCATDQLTWLEKKQNVLSDTFAWSSKRLWIYKKSSFVAWWNFVCLFPMWTAKNVIPRHEMPTTSCELNCKCYASVMLCTYKCHVATFYKTLEHSPL